MTLELLNTELKPEHRQYFGKIKVKLMKQILTDGFNDILDTGWEGDQKMIKDKLIDEKEF